MPDDQIVTEKLVRKEKKVGTIEKINIIPTVIENQVAAEDPNVKQEARQGKIVPSQANLVSREN